MSLFSLVTSDEYCCRCPFINIGFWLLWFKPPSRGLCTSHKFLQWKTRRLGHEWYAYAAQQIIVVDTRIIQDKMGPTISALMNIHCNWKKFCWRQFREVKVSSPPITKIGWSGVWLTFGVKNWSFIQMRLNLGPPKVLEKGPRYFYYWYCYVTLNKIASLRCCFHFAVLMSG